MLFIINNKHVIINTSMKKWIALFVLMGFLNLSLVANPYAKFSSEPSIGLGIRQSIGHHGCDLSLEMNPTYDERQYSAKSLYLFYPQPQKQARLYFGGGVAGTMREQKFPNYHVWKHAEKEKNLETVVGCEFLQNHRMKMYTQVECGISKNRSPEVRFSLGIGF